MRRIHKHHRSVPMPPEHEMVPPKLHTQRVRQAQYDDLPAPVRELVQEYGMLKTVNALRLADGVVQQARFILEEQVGPPLVPRRRRV